MYFIALLFSCLGDPGVNASQTESVTATAIPPSTNTTPCNVDSYSKILKDAPAYAFDPCAKPAPATPPGFYFPDMQSTPSTLPVNERGLGHP